MANDTTAIVRLSSIGAGVHVLAAGGEPIIQMTTRDRNRIAGKVIPPERIMQESLDQNLQDKLGQKIAAEILEQHHYEDQVAEAVTAGQRALWRQPNPVSGDGADGTGEGTGPAMEGCCGGRVQGDD